MYMTKLYYQTQLLDIYTENAPSELKIQVSSPNGKTNWINLNNTSIGALEAFLETVKEHINA